MKSIIKLSNYKNKKELFEMWNSEYGNIYPISQELFERNLQNAYDDATLVALSDGKAVGFIIGKIWQDEYKIEAYDNVGWISLIFVHSDYRKRGIGSNLLKQVESEFELLNKSTINIGRDYSDFFPGLPMELKDSLEWFIHRGYDNQGITHDLVCKNKEKMPIINSNYVFRTATINDKNAIMEFLHNNWPGRWTKEILDYWNCGGTGRECVICLDGDKVCAFAKLGYPNTNEQQISNSLTWRKHFNALGGIGPLGVDKEYRGRHLGYDIVASAKNILIDAGVSDIIIDWTSLMDFYHKFGFEEWKSYYYLTKKQKKEIKK